MKREFLIISVSAASVLAIAALAQDAFKTTDEQPGWATPALSKPASPVKDVLNRDARVLTNRASAAAGAVSNDHDRDDGDRDDRHREHRHREHRDRDDRVITNGTSAAASAESNDHDRDDPMTTNATPRDANR